MQVITLDDPALESHAERLAKLTWKDSTIFYDAIVAVRQGGSMVCDVFCRFFPHNSYGERYDIALQRPSTKHKGGALGRLLKHLPTQLLNLLRMAESFFLTFRHRLKHPSPIQTVELPEGLKKLLQTASSPKILVIDDAIDSGNTLYAIIKTLNETNQYAEVRTAVITETTDRARIKADYSLYQNRTLIRFPWSNDYKKH